MNAPAMPYDPPLRNGKSYRQLAHIAENIQAFVAIDGLLAAHGLRVPEMRAMDIDAGLLILGSGNRRHPRTLRRTCR